MNHIIDIESAIEEPLPELPDFKAIENIVSHTLTRFKNKAEISIRIVSDQEIAILNNKYRNKNKPTNVLSFPIELPAGIISELEYEPLGDIIIAYNIVKKEAIAQHKPFMHHFTHMLVHGTLHLLGFDHEDDIDAEKMEQEEIKIMQELNIPDPYN